VSRRSEPPAVVEQRQSPQVAKTGASIVVDALIEHGISTVFGVPGDTSVSLYDAIRERGDEIRHVLARDERHAATMADAFARASNSVGVVEVSSGGGVSFAVGGLGEAYAASVPVLVITSDIHSSSRGTGAITDIDQMALLAAVTKWRSVVKTADEIPALIGEAVKAAISGRPSPVAVILPEDVLDETARPPILNPALPATLRAASHKHADSAKVRLAIDRIEASENPVIIAGSGVHMSEAWWALERLADHAGIPVATTIHGKGAIADSSPWSLGVVGANGARPYANDYVAQSDAVVLIGTRANATDTNNWTGPSREHRSVVSINVSEDPVATNFPRAVLLVGDAAAVLDQISDLIAPADESQRRRLKSTIAASAAAWAAGQPGTETPDYTGRLDAQDVVRVTHRVLADTCSVVADPGTPTPHVASYWDVPSAGRSVIIPRGHGSMGFAIPGAVGVAIARPDTPVVSFTGDGSFAMACGELETVARFELPIIYIQLTNHSLGWIKMLQHLYFGSRYFGVDLGPIDAANVAKACGIRGVDISSLTQLESELNRFAQDPKPLYLHVEIPGPTESIPPVAPWRAALDGEAIRTYY